MDTGIILCELLTIIPTNKWKECITKVRHGQFPPGNGLSEIEKNLINAFLSPDPELRPYDLEDVMDCVDHIMESNGGLNSKFA